MLVLSIISIILSLAAIAVGLVLVFRIASLYGDMENLAKWQGEIDNAVKGLQSSIKDIEQEEGVVVYPDLEGIVYDEKTKTLNIKGNLSAEGWVSAGKVKEK